MSSSTQFFFEGATVSYPPVKPPWLRSVATAVVIAVHAFVAWITLVTSVPLFHPIDVTLVPSGSPLGLEEQEADDSRPGRSRAVRARDARADDYVAGRAGERGNRQAQKACRGRKAQNACCRKERGRGGGEFGTARAGTPRAWLARGTSDGAQPHGLRRVAGHSDQATHADRDVRRVRIGARPISRQRLRRHCRNLRLGIQSRGRGAGASHRRLHSRAAAAGRFVLRRPKFCLPLIEPAADAHLKSRLSTLIVSS